MRTSKQLYALRTWANTLASSVLVLGLLGSGQAVAAAGDSDVRNSKHNLGSSSSTVTRNNFVSGTGVAGTEEICVFCHTPHGAATGTDKPPLWNKALPSAASYTTYSTVNSSTIDGGVLPVGSVSLACLSCHDGSQAMDNMINAPGSGGYNAGGASPAGWTWTGNATMPASSVAMLGTDLRNDHPIGIEYCGGGLTGATNVVSGTCRDADFKNGGSGVSTANINGAQVFWVDTAVGTPGTRQRTDIALYTRDFTSVGGAAAAPSVECGSCHDPHVSSYNVANQVSFLRISNAASAVCLACHVK